jgi:SAM-dependent methyltransferase
MKPDMNHSELSKHGADLCDIDTIAEEIIAYTGESAETVWRRLARELAQTGVNVVAETKRFGVTPHVFDQAMVDFYTKSDGFIYETSIESRSPYRVSKWHQIAAFMAATSLDPSKRTALVYGDSVGNDCIFLTRMGFKVSYHDYDSYCSRYAKQRFRKRNLEVTAFTPGSQATFDYVVCFEVAEHVPSPPELVAELAGLTAEHGYCIFSESFSWIKPQFPTHLLSNLAYVGKSDDLFAAHGMKVEWRDPAEKPIVYTRHPAVNEEPATMKRGVLTTIKQKARAAYRG